MSKIIGYKPLKKTVAYMHRMINSGKWKANSRIPTLASIANAVCVSINTTRKAVAILEHERYLDNNGSLGYCVIPPDLMKLYTTNRQLYYIRLLKLDLQLLEMANKGAKAVGKYLISDDNDVLEIVNIVSGYKVRTSEKELMEAMETPVHTADLLLLKNRALVTEKEKYVRQHKLREIAKVVLKYRGTK